ncbi:MAG: endonuclease/exonuclease/phosphatase family protein [Thiohalomonadales bacterium]|nr:endonuclease/exonuclease/phosphatase family protein [Thiohalomonadales bacterium]
MPKFRFSLPRWLFAAVIGLWLSGCIHIPSQPTLVTSAADQAQTQTLDCETSLVEPVVTEIAQNGLSPARITLLTWNIYKQYRHDWLFDFQQFSRNKDLVILQEARMDTTLGAVLADSSLQWLMTATFYDQTIATGVLTAARVPSSQHCALYTPEPWIRVPKSILISTYPLTGKKQRLLVANVHGINFSLGLDTYRTQFRNLAKVLRQHRGPIILAGDFNSWREDRELILDELRKEFSLRQVGYENYHRTTVFGNSIDRIYYRGLELVETASPNVSSSDHNPLIVTFKLIESDKEHNAKTP